MHMNCAAPVLEGAVAHSRCVKSAAVTGGRGGRRGREQRQSGGERQQGPCCPVARACPGTLDIRLLTLQSDP